MPFLPNDLWPVILHFLSFKQRHRLMTLCQAWEIPNGIIDQSIQKLETSDILYMENYGLTHWLDERFASITSLRFTPEMNASPTHSFLRFDFARFTNLESLVIDNPFQNFRGWEGLTRLKVLVLDTLDSTPIATTTLTNLRALEHVFLCQCDIEGDQLRSSLRNLRHLDLYKAPNIGLSDVAKITGLESLVLRYEPSHYHSPAAFAGLGQRHTLSALTSLEIHHAYRFNSIVFKGLPSLRILKLVSLDCHIEPVHRMPPLIEGLTKLVMTGNVAPYVPWIAQHTQLRSLHFYHWSRSPDPLILSNKEILALSNLTSLHIQLNQAVTKKSLSQLTALTNLSLIDDRALSIEGYKVLPVSLRKLNLLGVGHKGIHGGYRDWSQLLSHLTCLKSLSLDTWTQSFMRSNLLPQMTHLETLVIPHSIQWSRIPRWIDIYEPVTPMRH